MIKNTGKKAFTLVELVVVVSIIAILSTVGFVAYSDYLEGARDSNRIAQLKSISDGLTLYSAQNSLPLPDNNVEIKSGNKVIAYQGYVGKNILDMIEYNSQGIDPKDKTYFSYYLTSNYRHFQLMAFLEEKHEYTSPAVQSASANEYEFRYPLVYGKKLGILTDENNTPIQEIESIKTEGNLNILTTTQQYVAHIENGDSITGDSQTLISLAPNASCKRLYLLGEKTDGIYTINPTGNQDIQVYCKMTLGGGGWTLIATSADDNTNTWTYNNRTYLWDNSTIGTLNNKEQDFKSPAYSSLNFKDMMFLDRQGVWGSYHDLNPNYNTPVHQWIPQTLGCAFDEGRNFQMVSGNVSKNVGVNDYQQDRMLFFTVYDNEFGGCDPSDTINNHNNYGPTWGYRANGGYSPDDPGAMGWGISDNSSYGSNQYTTREFGDARLGAKTSRIQPENRYETIETNDGDFIMWFVR